MAIVTNVMNIYNKSHLGTFLFPTQIKDLLQTSPILLTLFTGVFANGYNLQMRTKVV